MGPTQDAGYEFPVGLCEELSYSEGRLVEALAMDEPQIYARLAEIFENVFDEDSIKVTPELSAEDVDGWDSLAHIRLILTVEKAFKIKFSTSEIGKLENVGDLVKLIKARA
jgi:acyl carrier protein